MINKSAGAPLTGGAALADIYEVPTGKRARWVLMYITNTSGSNGTVDVKFYDASATATLSVLEDYTISSKDFLQVGGTIHAFIMMEEGDKIQANATQNMTILVSVIEENVIIQGG
jgi:hypothetical protein